MIFVEIEEPSQRVLNYNQEDNDENIKFKLDLANERKGSLMHKEGFYKKKKLKPNTTKELL